MFVVGPDKKIKLIIVYPMTTGRNFDEVLRVIDSLQLTATHKVSTPVNWKPGEDVIIAGSVSDDEAKKTYPQGWRAPRPYIRIVPQPGVQKNVVHYAKNAIATFEATPDTIFRYMSAGNHPHQAFKSHRLVGVSGNVVTLESEIYNPDGSTFQTTIRAHAESAERSRHDDDGRAVRRRAVRALLHAAGPQDTRGSGRRISGVPRHA